MFNPTNLGMTSYSLSFNLFVLFSTSHECNAGSMKEFVDITSVYIQRKRKRMRMRTQKRTRFQMDSWEIQFGVNIEWSKKYFAFAGCKWILTRPSWRLCRSHWDPPPDTPYCKSDWETGRRSASSEMIKITKMLISCFFCVYF